MKLTARQKYDYRDLDRGEAQLIRVGHALWRDRLKLGDTVAEREGINAALESVWKAKREYRAELAKRRALRFSQYLGDYKPDSRLRSPLSTLAFTLCCLRRIYTFLPESGRDGYIPSVYSVTWTKVYIPTMRPRFSLLPARFLFVRLSVRSVCRHRRSTVTTQRGFGNCVDELRDFFPRIQWSWNININNFHTVLLRPLSDLAVRSFHAAQTRFAAQRSECPAPAH